MRKGLVLFFIAGTLEGAVWIRTYDTFSSDTLTSAVPTSDGGFILLGNQLNLMLLVKLDSLGNILWGKLFNSLPDSLFAVEVRQTSDGGYIILGMKRNLLRLTSSSFVIKTDSLGNTVWTREFQDFYISLYPFSIQQTNDGGYIIVCKKDNQVVIIKLDNSENLAWGKYIQPIGSYDVHPSQIIQTYDGKFVIAGYVSFSVGGTHPFFIKLDSSGNVRELHHYYTGYMTEEYVYSIETDSGGFVMAGYYNNKGLIIKVDESGEIVWSKEYSHPTDSVKFFSIKRASDNGFVLTGKIGNYVFLVKTDSSGGIIWAKKYGNSTTSTVGTSVQVLNNGFFIGGTSSSGGSDFLAIKTGIFGEIGSCSYVDTVNLSFSNAPFTDSSLSDSIGNYFPSSPLLTIPLVTPTILNTTICSYIDTIRPRVISTAPANGATGVAPNTSITVVFSERINTGTVDTTSIRIVATSGSRTFTKSCPYDSVCVLTPTSFNYGDIVWVYFDTLITDLAGNRLIPDSIYFVVRDSTGGSDTTRPRVVLTRPDSGSIYVPLSANIGVWFSKPIIDTTVNASSVSITGWDGSSFRNYSFNRTCPMPNFCVLDPILNFRPNEEITVRFDSTIRDNSGNPLIPKVIVFRTQGVDTLNPVVVFTTPDSGAVNVPANTKISVQFSRDMDTTTINPTNVIINGSSTGHHTFTKVCRTLSYCEINPGTFNVGETVTVEFRSGIMALNGRNLVPRIITFTTGTEDNNNPIITIISDPDDTVRLYDKSIPIKAYVWDNYGIQKVEWVINSQTYISPTNCNGSIYGNPDTSCFYIPNIPTGTYKIIAYAYDYSGNVRADSAYLKYQDTIKPYVVFSDPRDNSYGISPTPLITVVFSEGMDTAYTSDSLEIRVGSSTYPYTKYWEDLRTLKIRNTTPLPYDSTVKVVLRNYRDLSGNIMVGDSFSFRFTIISNAEVFIRILNVNPNTVYKGSPDSTYILAEVSSKYNIRGAKMVINGSVEISMFAKDGSFDEIVETVYVRYRFGELEVGEYNVSVKAWNDYVERSSDPFIIKVKSIGFLDKENVVIYPNPAKGQAKLRVIFGANTNAVIEVFDLKVKRVYYREGSFDGFKTYEFELPKLPTGLYLVRIRAGDKKVEKWFSVIK
jgi:hypothetical protein